MFTFTCFFSSFDGIGFTFAAILEGLKGGGSEKSKLDGKVFGIG